MPPEISSYFVTVTILRQSGDEKFDVTEERVGLCSVVMLLSVCLYNMLSCEE